ncbi:hypothetical protein D9619_004928 [Psilocybe cf. subviscida]|uniref:NACHT domain-containing protein n=1 Tax=Psilocybe cf. subviscida TaxID=2480587 RepID=A0A8H5BNL5_9AGAR|nr:hypothetical protein D9619_004928 [Psilocybe cf. subviscida]
MLGEGEDYDGKRLIWLNGSAGAGKSAIMQSVIERYTRNAVILGSSSFSRADTSRNYAEVLVPTLAYQLARAFPAAIAVLEPVIHHDPLIFRASLHTQAYEFLVRPILYLADTGIMDTTFRGVFVIDGLDECSDPQKQRHIIQAVASMLCDYPLPVSFLITSRPEVTTTSAFQRDKRLHGIFSIISLDADVDAESDIRQFIVDSFLDILDSHPLRHHITMPWPDPSSINELVRKSSGHFIYAATAMKFIASSDEHPACAREVVKGLQPSRTESPFMQLDALYSHILTSAKFSSQVRGILRHYHISLFERSVAAVCRIHNICSEDVELFLSDIQSLVSLSPNGTTEMYITVKHASPEDFLMYKKRSSTLYTSDENYHASWLVTSSCWMMVHKCQHHHSASEKWMYID